MHKILITILVFCSSYIHTMNNGNRSQCEAEYEEFKALIAFGVELRTGTLILPYQVRMGTFLAHLNPAERETMDKVDKLLQKIETLRLVSKNVQRVLKGDEVHLENYFFTRPCCPADTQRRCETIETIKSSRIMSQRDMLDLASRILALERELLTIKENLLKTIPSKAVASM